jgi:hypothetical protein
MRYLLIYNILIYKIYYRCNDNIPGRTCTVVNDRLRWKTEIYGGRTQDPCTGTVYGVKRWETDTVYGDRIKIRSDLKVTVSTPYTELYDCRIRSYIIVCSRIRSYTVPVCVTFQIHTGSEWVYNMIPLILIVLLSLLYLYKTSDIFYLDIVG